MGVQWLVVAGFETDECIEATGRSALDLGYMTLFAEDACTAYEADSHDHFHGEIRKLGSDEEHGGSGRTFRGAELVTAYNRC